jgi:3-isopropylmalate/(R)-2-methylmalate dehydratase large subunit
MSRLPKPTPSLHKNGDLIIALTLYEKIMAAHHVCAIDSAHDLLYVDFQILNEYTSPQAFSGLRDAGRKPRSARSTLAVVDHVNSTRSFVLEDMDDEQAVAQIKFLRHNCDEFGIEMFDLLDPRQGIEHVVAPEQGFVQPGMVIVGGDSHTTTYGAFGAMGQGIGTSDIEHVLATQTIQHKRLGTMRVVFDGVLSPGITAKDMVMAFVGAVGAAGASGYAVEFAGNTVSQLDMAGRMTMCNMAVEAGARVALIGVDEKVIDYLKDRPRVPTGPLWDQACAAWRQLRSDDDANFDREVHISSRDIAPLVTWGTSPDQVTTINGCVPKPEDEHDEHVRKSMLRAMDYMDLPPGTPMLGLPIDHVFIGSCTNSRIEDLRQVAKIVRGKRVDKSVRAIIVPGSQAVRRQAEEEGLATIFKDAGFDWRLPGCSMCLAMNDDILPPGARCASSTNRNFEGRQGRAARTHLMSPAMAAAAAIAGQLVDVRDTEYAA